MSYLRRRWAGTLAALAALVAVATVPAVMAHGGAPAAASGPPTENFSQQTKARCFGAATRDPFRPCDNPRLRHEVVPAPSVARTLPNSPCTLRPQDAPLDVCAFGVPQRSSTRTVALVGDSHAGHWRAALAAVARAHRWYGLSITHTSCPLSKAVRILPTQARFQACAQWKQRVFAWFGHHPEVSTVFVSGLSGGSGVVPSGGRSEIDTSVAGYIAAWNALPPTVRHIVVIHDTPKMRDNANGCVARAVGRGQDAGVVCALPRRVAMDPDPLTIAADRLHSPRVQTVNLTHAFCDASRCFPVVGGALVLRDVTHLTGVFSASMGPYLLRDVNRLMAGWSS